MSKLKMWVAVLAVFLCGVLVGAVGGGILVRHKAKAAFERLRTDDGSYLTSIMMKGLARELNLTDKQQKEIRPILEKTSVDLQIIRKNTHQELKILGNQTVREIKTHLSSEQNREFDKLMKHVHLHRLLLPPAVKKP